MITLTDALATALMVLGPGKTLGRRKALALVNGWPGVDCVLVDAKGRLWLSRGLKGKAPVLPSAGAVKPGKVHRERSSTLGLRPELIGIPKHLPQRRLCLHGPQPGTALHHVAHHPTPAA